MRGQTGQLLNQTRKCLTEEVPVGPNVGKVFWIGRIALEMA